MAKKVVHIGSIKAGSTFLQTYFEKHPDIAYSSKDFGRFNQTGVFPMDFRATKSTKKIQMLSCEKLTCPTFNLFFAQGEFDFKSTMLEFQENMAKEVYQRFPDAKIVYITRNSREIIPSIYAQFIASGGVLQYDEFLAQHERYLIQILDFDSVYRIYAKVFGKENVIVLPFELLQKDKDRFLTSLAIELGFDYIDIPIKQNNKALSFKNSQRYICFSKFVYKMFRLFPKSFRGLLSNLYILFLEGKGMMFIKDRFLSAKKSHNKTPLQTEKELIFTINKNSEQVITLPYFKEFQKHYKN
jgi:hypothetical protein